MTGIKSGKNRPLYLGLIIVLIISFVSSSVGVPYAQADQLPWMPIPGVRVDLSQQFVPAQLKGITIHPENPLMFDFIIYRGDQVLSAGQKQQEYKKLVKYFLASLAIPDEDQWVNLSPYEKNRIIKDDFGKTLMGRDLLSQDYILKQITASLIYPEEGLGKKFWDKVYTKAQEQFGTTNVPVNTFNKVWIIPDDALIYEKGNTAYVLRNHLKVMLEEDYLSLNKHLVGVGSKPIQERAGYEPAPTDVNQIGSQVVRSIILPALEREVNEGKNFAMLRQVYSGMLLAAWFKRTLKKSILGQIYADKSKVKGVDQNPQNNEAIYLRYLKAYKKGVFDYIKENVDTLTNQPIPRKYFSGGMNGYDETIDQAVLGRPAISKTEVLSSANEAMVAGQIQTEDLAQVAMDRTLQPKDAAMIGFNEQENPILRNAMYQFRIKLPGASEDEIKNLLAPIEKLIGDQFISILNEVGNNELKEADRLFPIFNREVRTLFQKLNKKLIPRGYLVYFLPSLGRKFYFLPKGKNVLLKIMDHKTYKIKGGNFTIFMTRNASYLPVPPDEIPASWQEPDNPYGVIFLPTLESQVNEISDALHNPESKFYQFNIPPDAKIGERTRGIYSDLEALSNGFLRNAFANQDQHQIMEVLLTRHILNLWMSRFSSMEEDVDPNILAYLTDLEEIRKEGIWFVLAEMIKTFGYNFANDLISYEPTFFAALATGNEMSGATVGLQDVHFMLNRIKDTPYPVLMQRAQEAWANIFRRNPDLHGMVPTNLKPTETESLESVAGRIRADEAMQSPQERLDKFLSTADSIWKSIAQKIKQAIQNPQDALEANRLGFAIPRGQDKDFYGIGAALKDKEFVNYFESVQDAIAYKLGGQEELQDLRNQRALRKERLGKASPQEEYEFIHTAHAEFVPPGGEHVTLVSNVMKTWSEVGAVEKDLRDDTQDSRAFQMQVVGPQLMSNFGVTIQLTTQNPEVLLIKEKGLERSKTRNPETASMPPFLHSSVAYIKNATSEQLTDIDEGLPRAIRPIEINIDELNVEKGSIGRKEIQDYRPSIKLKDAAMNTITRRAFLGTGALALAATLARAQGQQTPQQSDKLEHKLSIKNPKNYMAAFNILEHIRKDKLRFIGMSSTEQIDFSNSIIVESDGNNVEHLYLGRQEIATLPHDNTQEIVFPGGNGYSELRKSIIVSGYIFTSTWRGVEVSKSSDGAMNSLNPGGIDLNSANLNLQIKRDGRGVPLPLGQQDLAKLGNIQGLDPVILSIKPASQALLFPQIVPSP